MNRLAGILLALSLAGFTASPAVAQARVASRATVFDYLNLRMVIAPDSEGTWLWTITGELGKPGNRSFFALVDPAALVTWVDEARSFLAQNLAREDTGDSRSSLAVRTMEGGRLYLFRRRSKGVWTEERFLAMQKADTAEPVVVNGTDHTIGEILDSLAAVGARTPRPPPTAAPDSGRTRRIDKHASPHRDNRPPAYPRGSRARGEEGTVLTTFVVGVNGRADMSTLVVVHSPNSQFTKAVIDQLPRLAFEPATALGVPVRERVMMPFAFSLYRGRLRRAP